LIVDRFREDLKELEELEKAIGPEKLEELLEQYNRQKELFIAIQTFDASLKLDSTPAHISEDYRIRKEAERRMREIENAVIRRADD